MIISVSADNVSVSPISRSVDLRLIADLGRLPVSLVADAQGREGVLASAVRQLTPGLPLAGSILPVRTVSGDNLAIHRAIDEVRAGDVLVIDAAAYPDRAVIGDLLGEALRVRDARGIVVDGAVRDLDGLRALGLPTFALATSPAGPFKNGPGAVGAAVACGGVICRPGDVVLGDADGVVVVAAERAAEVLALAQHQRRVEGDVRARAHATGNPLPSDPE